jgi:aspartyl/asparaginyl-tRNA synthetase
VRQQKQHAFVELSDGSHQTPLQIVATPELVKGCAEDAVSMRICRDLTSSAISHAHTRTRHTITTRTHTAHGTTHTRASTGCSIEVEGKIVESPAGKQKLEMVASRLNIIGACDPEVSPAAFLDPTGVSCRVVWRVVWRVVCVVLY